jgi:HAD superfamily hydrolase (TIGR01509 family)
MTTVHPLIFSKIPNLSEIRAAFPGIKALFFDMDGTLFDTEKYHIAAMVKIGKTHKIIPPYGPEEVHNLMVGRADHLVFEIIKYWENFPKHWSVRDFVDEKNKFFLESLKDVSSSTYYSPKIHLLILDARAAGLKIALVTSSEKAVTQALLKISGVAPFFDLILTRDDCPKHKPDPWPYLEAQRFFGLEPKEALIFEDSEVGFQAASESGSHAAKVTWYDAPLNTP